MALLLHSTPERGAVWGRIFAEAGEGFIPDAASVTDASQVTHLACWTPPADLARYPNLRTVICVGAGTDHFPALPDGVALSRTIAPGIEAMVRDWVVMATLALHRDLPFYLDHAARGEWQPRPARLARTRRVGIMGMGRIGRLAAESLQALGFAVSGYSRSGMPVEGVEIFGANRLDAFLSEADILVCLLPLTDETRGLMGSAIIGGKATEIIDAGHYLSQAFADWFDADATASEETKDLTGKRVLLVDDSPFFRNLLTPLLTVAGYEVTAAENASAALAYCEEGRDFDVIVSDIEMPGMNGFDFAKAVRDSRWQDVPMVALSSHTSPRDLDRGREAGFNDYVAKDDRDALLQTLSQTIGIM